MLTSVALNTVVAASRLLSSGHTVLTRRGGGVCEVKARVGAADICLSRPNGRQVGSVGRLLTAATTRAWRSEGNISSRAAGHELINTVVQVGAFRQNIRNTGQNETRKNTVLAASAHVLPFFFFCLSLIADVLWRSSVERICSLQCCFS